MVYRAEGSSYLLRQVPGSEKVGGLKITINPRSDRNGQLLVELTGWKTSNPPSNSEFLDECVSAAMDGVRSFARDHQIDLPFYDIILMDFLFNEVDSSPLFFRQAGRSAFRAALEALRSCEI